MYFGNFQNCYQLPKRRKLAQSGHPIETLLGCVGEWFGMLRNHQQLL
jgi:hypothetical protein